MDLNMYFENVGCQIIELDMARLMHAKIACH